jgi:hypothetical protein
MPSTIQSQTIGSADLCIALAASQFGRAHGYGDNWSTLRVALLCNFESTAANLSSTVLRIGLCRGTTNMPGDATTDNSYGIKFQPTWTYEGSTTFDYWVNPNPYPTAFCRVGSSESTGATTGGSNVRIGLVNGKRTCFFLDVIKGSPNYTFKTFNASSTSFADATPATFLTQAQQSTPSLSNYTYTSPTNTSLAVNAATNGILDTVYVGWNLLTPRLFISNLAVVRLA